jgi:hypothetical protein
VDRIAIIGAGAIGLEAALYGRTLGYEVQVYDRGRVGEHLRRWGHVPLFSPFGMNVSRLGLRSLEAFEEWTAPKEDAILTGEQHWRHYLLPLSCTPALNGRIAEGTEVVSVGRSNIRKGEHIGSSKRLSFPFRLLLRDAAGQESLASADVVLDCSGVYSCPNWAGQGGIPAPGERALRAAGRIATHVPDVLGAERAHYAGRHTLLIGSGSSAATTALALVRLAQDEPGTFITWVMRDGSNPYHPIEGDPLTGRAALYSAAHELVEHAREGHDVLSLHTAGHLDGLEQTPSGRVVASIDILTGLYRIEVDRVVANVGYQPDSSLYAELQIHECYASRGPMALAAALLGAGTGGDCLAQAGHGPETLRNPEPGFFILGAKSYGKRSQFLIRVGLEQVRDVYRLIAGDPDLDLYA